MCTGGVRLVFCLDERRYGGIVGWDRGLEGKEGREGEGREEKGEGKRGREKETYDSLNIIELIPRPTIIETTLLSNTNLCTWPTRNTSFR